MKDKVAPWCKNAEVGCTECKRILGEVLTKFLNPIQMRRQEYLDDKKKLELILERGREKARKVAAVTLKEVRGSIGLSACPTK
jgi:tryptophanyl-tRNA synthetase